MLRIIPIRNATAALAYYSKSDGGYFVTGDLRREWGGKGAALLNLSSDPTHEQFARLVHGLDPHTGEKLTSGRKDENSLAGWDINTHCPKGVTIAIERGDERVHDAFWEASREAMKDLEAHVQTRVRKGKHDDRQTGNLVWYATEHPETRPAKSDGMPDPHRHIHHVVFNLTYDEVEGQWKAAKVRNIMDLRKYFDRRFDMHLASKLADLGYGIETKWKSDRKYGGWDIKGIPQTVIDKFSRRSQEVKETEQAVVAAIKERDTNAPDQLSALAKDKLGATSRLHKRDDMTLEDYRRYWDSRVTPEEAQAITATIKASVLVQGHAPDPTKMVRAVEYALSHEFERASVVPTEKLAISAMERCMGHALPDDIHPEFLKQGLLVKDGLGTTKEVLAEESRMIRFAVAGKGTMRPLVSNRRETERDKTEVITLSSEQQAVIDHVMASSDQVTVVRGAAGTGKSTLLTELAHQIGSAGAGKRVTIAAPTTQAVGVLHKDGFSEAATLAKLLNDRQMQAGAQDGVIILDEAGLVGSKSMAQLFDVAEQLNSRVILLGDKRQLSSVERGSPLRVLEEYAGLPVAELSEVRRQSGKYKSAVEMISKGDIEGGYDALDRMGWVKELAGDYAPVAKEYVDAIEKGESCVIHCPTHAEGDKINDEVRGQMKLRGLLKDERVFEKLVPIQWTEAQRGDPENYTGDEFIRFHHNSGTYKAGARVRVRDIAGGIGGRKPDGFNAYSVGKIAISRGDVIRITAPGKIDGHQLANGATYTVAGFTEPGRGTDGGDIVLSNKWVIPKTYGFLNHAYVSTSFGVQGRTVDRVISVQSAQSFPAVHQEGFYVSASRGRKRVSIWTDRKDDLRDAIQRTSARMSATELMGTPKPKVKPLKRMMDYLVRMKERAIIAGKTAAMSIQQSNERNLAYGIS